MNQRQWGAILPGATIGMLGGGQLGRMFALAARPLGYRVVVLTDHPDGPAEQAADEAIIGPFDDDHVDRLAAQCDVMTLEFENIPVDAVLRAAERVPIYPSASILRIAQDRSLEKQTLADFGMPVTPFATIRQPADVPRAAETVGLPLILKTARAGYDGKGQSAVESVAAMHQAFENLGRQRLVAEQRIDFRCEVSVIVARNAQGQTVVYPVLENRHSRHILDVSVCPAGIEASLQQEAQQLARTLAERLQLVGLLCVEMFVTADGRLLINELAPRPHNSGHLTIEAATISQFEMQLRAICGLPLHPPQLIRPAAMVNLLGDLWSGGVPPLAQALSVPETHLHLYGKRAAKVGRKMGHLTATGDSPEQAVVRATQARRSLRSCL